MSTRFLAVGLAVAAILAGCAKTPDTEITKIRQQERAGNTEALAKEIANPQKEVARAAVEALGRLGPQAVPHIRPALKDDRAEVREAAAVAYAAAAKAEDLSAVAEVVRKDESPDVRAAAASALGQAHAFDQLEALFSALEDSDRGVRARAAAAVARIVGRRYETYVDGTPEQRREAVAALRQAWPLLEKGVRENYKYLHQKPK